MSNCIKDLVLKCSKCRIISLKSNFHKDNTKNDCLYNQCKVCRNEYYLDNRNRIVNNQKLYNKQNRDKINT